MPRRRPRDLHVASLMRAFARVPDPRPRGGRCHPLPAVLALATCALLDGARSLHGVAQWGRAQAPTTVATLGFICGRTPSAATLYHLFRQLDVGSLERAARAWLRSAAVPRRAVLTRGVARGQGAREDDAARVRPPPGSLVEQTTSRRRVHRRTVAPEVLAVLSMLAGAIEQYWGVSGVEGDDGTDGDRSRGVVLRLLQEDSADKTPRGASAPRVGAWTNSAPRRGEAPLPPPAPLGAPPSPKESLGRSPVWLYLAGAALAEVLIAAGEPLAGLLLHTSLAVGLLFHGANAPEQSYRHVLWGLSLGPLIRILSFSLPLTGLPLLQWYTIMLAVVLAATFVATRVLGYSRLDLGLVAPRMSVEGAVHIVSLGLVLGVVEHVVLLPLPPARETGMAAISPTVLLLVIGMSASEEIVFRGLMQRAVLAAFGPWGLVYVAALSALLHGAALPPSGLGFVFLEGLIFAVLAWRSGSVLGAVLAHASANVGVLLPGLLLDLG